MKSTTSIFKRLKTSWGISIRITGESNEIAESENQFRLEADDLQLSDRELNYLLAGYQWVAPIITQKTKKKYQISIKEIKLVYTDYQEEGLFYAIAFWLSEHFDFEMPDFLYEYNKTKNKYEFPELPKI